MHECFLGLRVTDTIVCMQRSLPNDIRRHALFVLEGRMRVQRLIVALGSLDWDLDSDLFDKMDWLPTPVETD